MEEIQVPVETISTTTTINLGTSTVVGSYPPTQKGEKPPQTGSSRRTANIKTIYDLPNEYNEMDADMGMIFKSDRQTKHQKIIKFPDPALIVNTSETILKNIRDTFRSKVNVKLIYLKVIFTFSFAVFFVKKIRKLYKYFSLIDSDKKNFKKRIFFSLQANLCQISLNKSFQFKLFSCLN